MELLANVLVICPKYPTEGVIPLAFCNLMTAARVSTPKNSVSFPTDPDPERETVYPWPFKYCWSSFTSASVIPMYRSLVNFGVAAGVLVADGTEEVVEAVGCVIGAVFVAVDDWVIITEPGEYTG
jgi:hypothetical protein